MIKQTSAASPDAYVAALSGWQRPIVDALRAATRAAGKLQEAIKWGHLVYVENGPVLLIRAEPTRVLFGFWRGKRLREMDENLVASGKYEMATITFMEGDEVDAVAARHLVKAAMRLNRELGDPTAVAVR